MAARGEGTVTEAILRAETKAARVARAGNPAVEVVAAVAGSMTQRVDRRAVPAATEGVDSAMLRLSSIAAILLLCLATDAAAARYAIVTIDGTVHTVIEQQGDPALIIVPPGASAVPVAEGDRAESGGTYSGGTFRPRPLRNEDVIGQRLDAALDANRAFLALAPPTLAQNAAQIRALTQQINGLLRVVRNRLDGTD